MDHPVWEVYNEYRTARLNVKYYSSKLGTLQRRNFWIELTLALTASSGIAGLWVFETWLGGYAWKAAGTVAAVLAVYRPVARLSEGIRRIEERVTAYRGLELDLERLCRDIRRRGQYDSELRDRFDAVMDRKGDVVRSYIDTQIDEPLRESCESQVNQELPVEGFFVPEEVPA